jgi:soluble lytic murein transglycosylase-like protein
MQIMAIYHYKHGDPRDLNKDDDLNVSIGTGVLKEYIGYAKKIYGKKYLPETFRFYNAGPSKPVKRRASYPNWDYVNRIIKNIKNTRKIRIKVSII